MGGGSCVFVIIIKEFKNVYIFELLFLFKNMSILYYCRLKIKKNKPIFC